jgi:PAS domain S-box-containing protein
LSAVFLLLLVIIYLMVALVGNSIKALQESEQKYRNFVEQSIEGVWLLAFDHPISTLLPAEEQVKLIYQYGYIAECNDSLAHMYGYGTREELIGVRLFDIGPGKAVDEVNFQATLKLVKDGYRSGNRETREMTRTGEIVYFMNSAVGVLKGEYLVGLWGTQLDITPLKKAEEAMSGSEARMKALLDAIPDMIFEMDRDGRFLRFIPSANNHPIMPPEEFLGKTISEVLPSLAEQTAFAINRALESGQLTAIEYDMNLDGETKTFESRISPAGPNLVLAMVRDVTLRKWAEAERESLIVELESKNAELERFTYTVSHDLKSPLITIKGFLGFIREDTERGNTQRLATDIQRINDATDKMQNLLADLLELSRIGRLTNEPETVHLNVLVNEVLEILHGRIYSGNITVRFTGDLPDVFGDRQRIFEVFQNLIDNAAKFMGDQPNPCIEIGQDGLMDGNPIFHVRDNGVGIEVAYKEKIFGLFNKLDSQTEGTGIGLTLVKRIVEFHGGRIWVESEPDKGSTFFFTLPTIPAVDR